MAATVGTIVLFTWGAPLVAANGPSSTRFGDARTLDLNLATVTVPAGWDVDLASAASSTPVVSKDGVTVGISDVIWFGGSDSLVKRVGELALDGAATLPEVPEDASGEEPERWDLASSDPGVGDGRQSVVVLRDAQAVVLVTIDGAQADIDELADQIEGVIASIEIAGPELDVEARA